DGTEMTNELQPLSSPVDYTNPSILSTIQSYNFDRFEQLIGYRFHQRGDIFLIQINLLILYGKFLLSNVKTFY
ncbi:unnamed protein product, partial [Adineta steineri]